MKPRLIAIIGGSGAGKTWLADRLQKIFGTTATRLSLDHFYLDRSTLPLSRRARINFDHPRAIDWRLAESVLRDCRAGRTTQVPRYSFATHIRLPRSEEWTPTPIVIWDGLWLLRRSALRNAFDFKIFLECPAQLRLERRIARDAAERARGAASIREQFWKTVTPMHDRFVAPQSEWADLVLTQPCDETAITDLVSAIRATLPDASRPAGGTSKASFKALGKTQMSNDPFERNLNKVSTPERVGFISAGPNPGIPFGNSAVLNPSCRFPQVRVQTPRSAV